MTWAEAHIWLQLQTRSNIAYTQVYAHTRLTSWGADTAVAGAGASAGLTWPPLHRGALVPSCQVPVDVPVRPNTER